jgi:hypothetical protein
VNTLVKKGYRKTAWATGIGGLCVVALSVVGYAQLGSDNRGGSTDSDVRITETRAWLSPDGTGGNCAWFDGPASSHGGNFVFCGYPAP